MIKRSFFGIKQPVVTYEPLPEAAPAPEPLALPSKAMLFCEAGLTAFQDAAKDAPLLKIGDRVKTGQRFRASKDAAACIATVTGTIESILPYTGDFGKAFLAIAIKVDPAEVRDDQFQTLAANPCLDDARRYLGGIPGNPDFDVFADPVRPIRTIIVLGADQDLLVTTQQYAVKKRLADLVKGIGVLKSITGVQEVIVVVPADFLQGYGHIGATVKAVGWDYPAAHPRLVAANVAGREIPVDGQAADAGIAFLNAEAVASLGKAYDTGEIPFDKVLTIIDKTGGRHLVKARIGTPLKDVLGRFGLTAVEGDRVILGGPMTGKAIYLADHPVGPDTNVIMLQDRSELELTSDYPCINCGECVRICPARIQVNMLVRFLEVGQYETAADEYDLFSCIECGLCGFVCVAKIPVFQLIRLGKYELGRTRSTATEAEA